VKPLLIHIDQIDEASQPWDGDLSREFLDEVLRGEPPTEYHAAGASHVRADLTKMGRKVLARGRFNVPLQGQCKRCLKPLALDEPVEFTLTFIPGEGLEPPRHGGSEPRASDEGAHAGVDLVSLDEETYSGKEIDLAPALREQVLLALPPSPLCREDCRGLCAFCGADRNLGECGHGDKQPDPRWQPLKNIQIEKKE